MSTVSISRKIRTNFRFVKKIPEAETPGTRRILLWSCVYALINLLLTLDIPYRVSVTNH